MAEMNVPTFVILIVCFASIALADDFKTINGKEYKDATVSRVEGMASCSKPNRESRKSISLNCPKTFKNAFITILHRPPLHPVLHKPPLHSVSASVSKSRYERNRTLFGGRLTSAFDNYTHQLQRHRLFTKHAQCEAIKQAIAACELRRACISGEQVAVP